MAVGDGYSAGNLIFQIQAMGKDTTANFSKLNAQLKTTTFSLTNLINKIYFLRNYTKQMFASLKGVLKNAVDYTETLNLWQVAMRGNREEAEEFVNVMNKAYGISTQTLMNYQAIFKNMLSSLGGVSNNVSYQLSEFLTQMALDYASLYNTSIQKAMTTFQSVLSGQVRPIRSIAGYDITETTIYQLYQQLGGTKTMRQLSQTEKRLLRIYAVFQQMESSGAIGDLGKTLGSTSNQMRIMSESLKELGTWIGIIIENYIAPVLPKINAFFITLTNIVKAFAQLNNIKPQEFGVTESVEQLNEALEQTEGKLLSFDKFEALNSGEDNNIFGIDENLLSAISKYSSVLDGVTGKAQELAEQWTALFIEYDAEGNLVGFTEKAKNLFDVLKSIGTTLGVLIGYKLITKIGGLFVATSGLTAAFKILNFVLISGLIYSLSKVFETFQNGEYWSTALYIAIAGGTGLVLAIRLLNKASADTLITMAKFLTTGGGIVVAIGSIVAGIGLFISNLEKLSNRAKILIPILSALAGVIAGIAIAKAGMTFRAAITAGAITAGIGMVVGTLASIKQYKTGGAVEDGVFTMNRKEMAGSFDDGTSIIANNMQIQQGIADASYRGLSRAIKESGYGGGVGDVILDGRKVGYTTAKYSHEENVRTGLVKATR